MTSGSGFSAMLLALALTLVGCLHDSPAEENFWGIEMPGEVATDFTLVNHYNASFSLNETADRVVVMTFIYTHCPDVCPAATYQLTKLQEALGDNYGTSVEILSITVDPERDTVERLANWSTGRNASWPHLTSEAEMPETVMNASVWGPYGVYVEKVDAKEHEHDENSDDETGDNQGNETNDEEHADYGVNHSTILYIIDKQGRLRVAWPGLDWTYRDIHHDVVLLLD
jgi:protein SCO1/2